MSNNFDLRKFLTENKLTSVAKIINEETTVSEVAELIKTKYQSIVAKTMQLVYGGSVNSENCKDIINIKDISGILVGGASLNKDKLFKILNS